MARGTSISIENNFRAGLITEVTGVNSPENSVTETLDVVYDRRGRAKSRLPFAYEPDTSINIVATPTTGSKNEFLWETVSENSAKTFVVVQCGSRIRFFDVVGGENLTDNLETFSVSLSDYIVSPFTIPQMRGVSASFSSGKGYLFIAHPMCNTLYVDYDPVTNSITANTITVVIRDFEGVEDNLGIDVRPNSITNAHKYNLFNQGWYADVQRRNTDDVNSVQAFAYWDSIRTDYPSNSDVWWYYTTTSASGSTPGPATPLGKFDPDLADTQKSLYGNTPAPKGHYIVNAFQTNRSTLSGIPSVVEATSNGYRPSVVAFFAGRVFYAGVGHPKFSSTVYFSQIVEDDDQLGRCFQLNDPTSKESFDLLATDGGTVKIQDINTVLDMKVIGQSLFIFASNGVWSITGSNDGPFKATDYFVSKVSSFPALSKNSIVDVGGLPIWWNYEGIFALERDQVGSANVTNLTQTTIQEFYDGIPQSSKRLTKGAFNDQEGLVYWLYQSENLGTYVYDRILVFDVTNKAFYPLSVPKADSEHIAGLVSVRGDTPAQAEDSVITELGDPVIEDGMDTVVIDVVSLGTINKKVFKFVMYNDIETGLRWAEFSDVVDFDFDTFGFTPFFVSGYRIRGELLKKFQNNYLTVIMEYLDNSSCYVQGIWDYSNTPDSGKYTNPQQAFLPNPMRDYVRRKLRIRGNGYSLQFKFYGEPGKPFSIVGWSGFETSNQIP